MDVNVINELQNGLSAAYINGSVAANLAYKPAFVSNNPEEGKKVISSVEDELLRCERVSDQCCIYHNGWCDTASADVKRA